MQRCISCETRFESPAWTCPDCGFAPQGGSIPIFAPELTEGAGGDYPQETYADWRTYESHLGYWFRPRGHLIAWALHRHAPGARSFLDAGCGAGSVLESIRATNPGIELTGADASPGALKLLRARVSGVRTLQMDAGRIPFRDEFDAVGSFDVIEHLEDDLAAVTELAAAVRPGGAVLITVPQHHWLWSAEDEAGGHKRRYRRGELKAVIERSGLELEWITSYVFSLLPLMALVRLRRRKISAEIALEQARRPAPGARILEAVLRAEVGLTMRGVSWPAGGSLLAVARRSK